jgi:sugar-specific transcriptional regulator TrmB
MKNIDECLKELGLSKHAATIYLMLLRTGMRPASAIHRELMVDKASCYRALKELVDTQLVDSIGTKRNQQYAAVLPNKLQELVSDREQKLAATKAGIDLFVEHIHEYATTSYKSKNVTIYEGPEGYISYLDSRLVAGTKVIWEAGGLPAIQTFTNDYYGYMKSYIPRRVKLGIPVRVLLQKNEKTDEIDVTRTDILKEVRRLPFDLTGSTHISTWGKHASFYSRKGNEYLGVVIHDPMISAFITSILEALWNLSTPVYSPDVKGNI